MEAVYILEGARTAFGSFGGQFKNMTDIELAVTTAKEAIRRSGVNVDDINDVSCGVTYGLASLCIGGGQGIAIVIESI